MSQRFLAIGRPRPEAATPACFLLVDPGGRGGRIAYANYFPALPTSQSSESSAGTCCTQATPHEILGTVPLLSGPANRRTALRDRSALPRYPGGLRKLQRFRDWIARAEESRGHPLEWSGPHQWRLCIRMQIFLPFLGGPQSRIPNAGVQFRCVGMRKVPKDAVGRRFLHHEVDVSHRCHAIDWDTYWSLQHSIRYRKCCGFLISFAG